MSDPLRYRQAIDGRPRKPGRPRSAARPGREELQRLYVAENRSVREIAGILGCSKDVVYRALQELGIKRRPRTKASRLWEYTLEDLEKGIRRSGIRGYARELGIHESTLRYHIKARRKRA